MANFWLRFLRCNDEPIGVSLDVHSARIKIDHAVVFPPDRMRERAETLALLRRAIELKAATKAGAK